MTGRLELSEEHERIVRAILAACVPAGVSVRAFGSRVWGKPRPFSDLDLALNGDDPIELSLFADLRDAFCESDLPFKVDVSDLRAFGPALREAVERHGFALGLSPLES